MSIRLKVMVVLLSFFLIVLIIELVRRRKLKEEYSWLWMITGAVILISSVWDGILIWITRLIGAGLPASTLFFFGLVFLLLISLHYSVKASALTTQVKNVGQKLAILENEYKKIEEIMTVSNQGRQV